MLKISDKNVCLNNQQTYSKSSCLHIKNVRLQLKEKSKIGQRLNYNYKKHINCIKTSSISLCESKINQRSNFNANH